MGRKRDPKIQELRERALEMKLAGRSPVEISQEKEFVEFGADADKVRRWLREIRGPRPKARDEFKRLKHEGRPRAEIVEELGISEWYAWELERELEGPKRVSAKKRLPTFFESPEKHRFAAWAITESFGWELNHRLLELVDDKPADWNTAECVRRAIEHLEALLGIRRGTAARWTRCQLVQAVASQAARLRSIGAPDYALLLLKHGRELAEACPDCAADLNRRAGAILKDLARLEKSPDQARQLFDEALACVRRARQYYLEISGFGHDPHGNGIGNCALGEAVILGYAGRPERALEVARAALLDVEEGGVLYYMLLFNVCYFSASCGKTAGARKVLEKELATYFRGPGLGKIKISCLQAKLDEADGDLAAAIEVLDEALANVEDYVKLPSAAAYILGELERLSGNDGFGLDVRIEVLGEAKVEGQDNGKDRPLRWAPPSWLGDAFDAFDRARQLSWLGAIRKAQGAVEEAQAAFKEALALLRAEARAFMPV